MISTPRGVGQSASSLLERTLSARAGATGLADAEVVGELDVVEVDEVHPTYASTITDNRTARHAFLEYRDIALLSRFGTRMRQAASWSRGTIHGSSADRSHAVGRGILCLEVSIPLTREV
jgi:hypothetical protein